METPRTCLKTQDLAQKKENGLRKYVPRNSGQTSWGLRSLHTSSDHGDEDSQNDGDEVDVT